MKYLKLFFVIFASLIGVAGDVHAADSGCGLNAQITTDGVCNCLPHYNSNGNTTDIGPADCVPNVYKFTYEYPTKAEYGKTRTKSFYFKYGTSDASLGDVYCFSDSDGMCDGTSEIGFFSSVSDWDWRYRPIEGMTKFVVGVDDVCGKFVDLDANGYPVIKASDLYSCVDSNPNGFKGGADANVITPKQSWYEPQTYTLYYYDLNDARLPEEHTHSCEYYANSCSAKDLSEYLNIPNGQILQGWKIKYLNGDSVLYDDTYFIGTSDPIDIYENSFRENTFSLLFYPVVMDCPDGSECNNGSAEFCPQGYYCVGDVKMPCGPGTYCPNEGMGEPWPCEDGWYCEEEANTEQKLCQPGNYCKGGRMIKCESGYYCPDEGMTDQEPCDVGYYCPGTNNSTQQPCPGGTTTDDVADGGPGATSRTQCYVVGGQDGTSFTDNTGKVFHLPVDVNIHVK